MVASVCYSPLQRWGMDDCAHVQLAHGHATAQGRHRPLGGSHATSRRWSQVFSSHSDLFHGVKKRVSKIASFASNIFSGIRSCSYIAEGIGLQFPGLPAKILALTLVVDFYSVPYTISVIAHEFFCLFAIRSLTDGICACMSLATNLNDLFYNGAMGCYVLNVMEYISEEALAWCDTFYLISCFVNLINIRSEFIAIKETFTKLHSLGKKQEALRLAEGVEQKKGIALQILEKLERKKEGIKERTMIKKKALKEKICSLKLELLDNTQPERTIDHVDELLRLLSSRTKKLGVLSAVDLASSVVGVAACAVVVFTPFDIASTVLYGISGIVTFVLWGGRILFIKKDPFVHEKKIT
jgi:hypothetical protein